MVRFPMPDIDPRKALFAIATALFLVSCGFFMLYARDRPEFKVEAHPDPTPANDVLDAVLTSEVRSVQYTDAHGAVHTYTNMTGAKLILMDIGLRDMGGAGLNKTSLVNDIEGPLREMVQDEVGTRPFTVYILHGMESVTISGVKGSSEGVESVPVRLTNPKDGSEVTVKLVLG